MNSLKWTALIVSVVLLTGCATTRARKGEPTSTPKEEIARLQSEVQAKDQEIQDLRAQLDSFERSLSSSSYPKAKTSSAIRISGVSVRDVQQALERAGFDPGSVDGKMGKKTKSALKDFQRSKGLTADGVVGEKTWALLNG